MDDLPVLAHDDGCGRQVFQQRVIRQSRYG
jgi:hypothetical protein